MNGTQHFIARYKSTLATRQRSKNATGALARAVPDFGSGRNPALFLQIQLRQKSHRSRIVLPDLII